MRASLAVVVIAAACATTSVAAAADAGAGGPDDPASLLKKLSEEHATLSTSDCNDACRALGSIRRAADKICTIEPGPRCDAARDKAADATRRVQAACPDCAIAAGPIQADSPPPSAHGGAGAKTANAPPAQEASKGGCASCSTINAGSPRLDLGWIAVLALLATRALRSIKQKDRPPRKARRDL